jgi:hypothetical protein
VKPRKISIYGGKRSPLLLIVLNILSGSGVTFQADIRIGWVDTDYAFLIYEKHSQLCGR